MGSRLRCRGLEHGELADEATGELDAGKREQEQRKDHPDNRIPPSRPAHWAFAVASSTGIADQANHGKGAQRAETIGEQVEQRRGHSGRVRSDYAGG